MLVPSDHPDVWRPTAEEFAASAAPPRVWPKPVIVLPFDLPSAGLLPDALPDAPAVVSMKTAYETFGRFLGDGNSASAPGSGWGHSLFAGYGYANPGPAAMPLASHTILTGREKSVRHTSLRLPHHDQDFMRALQDIGTPLALHTHSFIEAVRPLNPVGLCIRFEDRGSYLHTDANDTVVHCVFGETTRLAFREHMNAAMLEAFQRGHPQSIGGADDAKLKAGAEPYAAPRQPILLRHVQSGVPQVSPVLHRAGSGPRMAFVFMVGNG